MRQSRLRRSRLGYGIAVGISAFGLAACGSESSGEKTVTELEPRPELSLREKTGRAYGRVIESSVIYCKPPRTHEELKELTGRIGEYSALRLDLVDGQEVDDQGSANEDQYVREVNKVFPEINPADAASCRQ